MYHIRDDRDARRMMTRLLTMAVLWVMWIGFAATVQLTHPPSLAIDPDLVACHGTETP